MPLNQGRRFFGRNASVLLDLVRFAAALAVALSHMPLHYVSAAPLVSEHAGNQAVCVFFVLSGFVIRYITVARVPSGRDYFIDRASRLYSVVLPLLLLTFVLEPAAAAVAPGLYNTLQYTHFTWAEMPAELLHNLTFTVGWWDWGRPPLSNGSFWSLSFECVYYALYGLWCYAPRLRWWLIPLLLLASGPGIALLFPIWLLGVLLHEIYVRWHEQRRSLITALTPLLAFFLLLTASRRMIARLLAATTHDQRVEGLTRVVASSPWGQRAFHGATLHWLEHFSLSFFITGPLVALVLLPVLLGLDAHLPPMPSVPARLIRAVADSTFTLYLLHEPLFLFIVCLRGRPLPGWGSGWAMLFGVVLLSMALAQLFDRFKVLLRSRLRYRVGQKNAPRSALT